MFEVVEKHVFWMNVGHVRLFDTLHLAGGLRIEF